MKATFFIIFILISSISFAQIQKIFYVNDVKTIDYVTVKFCVNDSARIHKVTILQDKTTYKNKKVIERLTEYLKTIQYLPTSKLKNNCYPSTFEFVHKRYKNAQPKAASYDKCKKFKKGKFEYLDVRYLDTKIKRTKNRQVEDSDDFKAEYKIKWTTPCEYEMTYIKVREKENEQYLGETIKVKIIGLLEHSYIYVADFMNAPTVIGEMKKIK